MWPGTKDSLINRIIEYEKENFERVVIELESGISNGYDKYNQMLRMNSDDNSDDTESDKEVKKVLLDCVKKELEMGNEIASSRELGRRLAKIKLNSQDITASEYVKRKYGSMYRLIIQESDLYHMKEAPGNGNKEYFVTLLSN